MKARRIISLSIALVTLLACLLPLQAGALEYPTPEGVSSALLYNVESGSALIDVQGGKTVNFYQYNTSPKALSRGEIYRQTKNQLRFATANA